MLWKPPFMQNTGLVAFRICCNFPLTRVAILPRVPRWIVCLAAIGGTSISYATVLPGPLLFSPSIPVLWDRESWKADGVTSWRRGP